MNYYVPTLDDVINLRGAQPSANDNSCRFNSSADNNGTAKQPHRQFSHDGRSEAISTLNLYKHALRNSSGGAAKGWYFDGTKLSGIECVQIQHALIRLGLSQDAVPAQTVDPILRLKADLQAHELQSVLGSDIFDRVQKRQGRQDPLKKAKDELSHIFRTLPDLMGHMQCEDYQRPHALIRKYINHQISQLDVEDNVLQEALEDVAAKYTRLSQRHEYRQQMRSHGLDMESQSSPFRFAVAYMKQLSADLKGNLDQKRPHYHGAYQSFMQGTKAEDDRRRRRKVRSKIQQGFKAVACGALIAGSSYFAAHDHHHNANQTQTLLISFLTKNLNPLLANKFISPSRQSVHSDQPYDEGLIYRDGFDAPDIEHNNSMQQTELKL